MQPIIKVENLGKSYLIGHQREKYVALRDVLANKARQTASNAKKFFTGGQLVAGTEMEEFWALKDINFEVQQGDRVGIIGRNGAGKSTLLKVLSRITEPTTGRIQLKGRVASLLEVGTGFHPELSGRENIYLNGAILGMGRAEVRKKFDEIVDFAGVEKFLDTPVKRYSSGMYVRLAFAVAAHLEPEILIIDEVLAVGDAEFQKKCLGKMEDVSKKDGRTVLFVSHNMAAVSNLCNSAILLDKGGLVSNGNTSDILSLYLCTQLLYQDGDIDLSDPKKAIRKNSLDNSTFKWTRAQVINSEEELTTSINLFEPFKIVLTGYLKKNVDNLIVGFGVMSKFGFSLFNSHSIDSEISQVFNQGLVSFIIKFDQNFLASGQYVIDLAANGSEIIDWIPEAIVINIAETTTQGKTLLRSNYSGVVVYPCNWEIAT